MTAVTKRVVPPRDCVRPDGSLTRGRGPSLHSLTLLSRPNFGAWAHLSRHCFCDHTGRWTSAIVAGYADELCH
ncbi:hypothetical protein K1719_027001 [Acacia pycnantha]|nr:hypothetical protein K1719_027001 [Acacia pycnantha]